LGVFLAEHFGNDIQYHGMDNNPALLARARQSLQLVSAQLEDRDIVEHPPETGSYDLVALFGVLHHIPGAERRLALIKALANRLAAHGMLIFTCWRFYEYPRFRERIVPIPEDLNAESGDYLLDWRRGSKALRYCHYVDDEELNRITETSGLRPIMRFRADGESGDMNMYVVLKAE
jgi:2-polyprenyl-3-methyl-5-hydroxy-6-metoxy-1,4-benzoquinol methylase